MFAILLMSIPVFLFGTLLFVTSFIKCSAWWHYVIEFIIVLGMALMPWLYLVGRFMPAKELYPGPFAIAWQFGVFWSLCATPIIATYFSSRWFVTFLRRLLWYLYLSSWFFLGFAWYANDV